MKNLWLTCASFIIVLLIVTVIVLKTFMGGKPATQPLPTIAAITTGGATEMPPGSTDKLPRPKPGAAAIITHAVSGMKTEDCIHCHRQAIELAEGHRATKIPTSHFRDPQTKQVISSRVSPAYGHCLQCHPVRKVDAGSSGPQKGR